MKLLLVTGDLVGYYFWPEEVLELLASWDSIVVRGNHEEMLAKARRRPEILEQTERKYGSGLRVALEKLSSAQLDWLENLPHPQHMEIDGKNLLLCHGSPWDLDQYIYPDAHESLLHKCSDTGYDWVVLGHTHYPMEAIHGTTRIINPGSVGQPRNRQPGAHWALLDTDTGALRQYCEAYDIDWVVERSRLIQPNMAYLRDVLTRT